MSYNIIGDKIDFQDSKIYYDVHGFGESVVLLHGFLEDRSIWKDLVEIVREKYRVITIDLPGHGQSGCFSEVHSMEIMAEAVKAVLDYLDVGETIMAGHSMGGYVTLAFADLYPARIKAIGLINSTPKADDPEKKVNRIRAVETVRHNRNTFVNLTIPSLFSQENSIKYAAEIENLKLRAASVSIEGITAALLGMKDRPDRSQLILSGQFPSLIVLGKEDMVVQPESLNPFYELESVTIAELGGGHMSYIESKADLSYFFMYFIENL